MLNDSNINRPRKDTTMNQAHKLQDNRNEIQVAFDQIGSALEIIRRLSTMPPPAESEQKIVSKPPPAPAPPRRRRRHQDLEVLELRIAAAVAAVGERGIKSSELRRILRINKADMSHPLRMALSSGRIRLIGMKKGARYYPGSEV